MSTLDVSLQRANALIDDVEPRLPVSNTGRPAFLVEAKRQGQLATTVTRKQLYKISGPALKHCVDGIEQAASYCAPEGIQLAVVTDGTKCIFFKPLMPIRLRQPPTTYW